MTDPKRLACVSIHRERRAVQLTNYGQRLAARARQVLDVCSTARAEMRAILRKRLLLASCRLLAFLLDRSYISYQRPHCGSGSSPEWPSYIGTGDHVADRCAATGEGKADEIDRVLRRRPGVSVEGHRRALLTHIPLGPRPWLHQLRSRLPGFVRRLHSYYGGVRLLTIIHHRLLLLSFPTPTSAARIWGFATMRSSPCSGLRVPTTPSLDNLPALC